MARNQGRRVNRVIEGGSSWASCVINLVNTSKFCPLQEGQLAQLQKTASAAAAPGGLTERHFTDYLQLLAPES